MIRHALERASNRLALIGGLSLIIMALITMISIFGRTLLDRPIPGDIELAQLLTAFAISSFLPWCQVQKAHVFVDFFTTSTSPTVQHTLQRFGLLLLAVIFGVLAWRTMMAAGSALQTSETTMLLSIPIWVHSVVLIPGFLLASLMAVMQAIERQDTETRS